MAKRGPKPVEINWADFDKLCVMQCTLAEIASWFDCSEDTIERNVKKEKGIKFADYFRQKRGKGKVALRRKQYELAIGGNVTLLIWLGKQWLDQKEKYDVDEKSETHIFTQEEDKLIADKMRRIYKKREDFDKGPVGNA